VDEVLQQVAPEYEVTVGELKQRIEALRDARPALATERVGTGFSRALHATYLSYLPPEAFTYSVPVYADSRGRFAEVLKTADSGQFSFFTAHPGVTRGGHYHHTKTEKFLVVKGTARFNFRQILTQDCHSVITSGDDPIVVETIPGWSHDITNVGDEEMIVMLWANEIFDRAHPDTVKAPV
jgi:UDP-2-acetamido-2,6-beta-L-arabino-hexul-4-ose reductase